MAFLASLALGAADYLFGKMQRKDDEKRLRANQGVNFKLLRKQAEKAGFNPLTALMATGGAGYQNANNVLQTPFSPFFADAYRDAEQTRQFDASNALETRRVDVLEAELTGAMAGNPFGAPTVRDGRLPAAVLPSGRWQGPSLPADYVRVDSMVGPEYLKPGAAKALGLRWGDWMTESMRTELLGEVVGEYVSVTQTPFADGPFMGPPLPAIIPADRTKYYSGSRIRQ